MPARPSWPLTIGLGLVLFAIFELVLISAPPLPSRPTEDQTLKLALPMPILTLDPYEYYHGAQNEIFPFIYSFLLIPNRDGTFSPDLAEHWFSRDQDLTWEFILRPEARFHDGRQVLATDVAYSMERMLRDNPILAEAVARIETPHTRRVVMHLRHRVPHLLYQIAVDSIVPRPLPGSAPLNQQPVGSGPFRVVGRLDDKQVFLTRFDQYYGQRPAWKSIEIDYVPSEEKIWRDLMHERIHFCETIAPENVHYLHVEPERYNLEGRLNNKAVVLLFNTHDPLLADRELRQSLARMLDLDEHIALDLRSMAKPCPGPLGFESPYLPESTVAIRPDWTWARQVLEEKGWLDHDQDGYRDMDGRTFEFQVLLSPDFDTDKKTADYLQLAFNQFGIRARMIEKRYDHMFHENLTTGNFQACLTWHNTNKRYVNAFVRLWASNAYGVYNFGKFHDQIVDQALNDLLTKDSEQEYVRVLQTFHKHLVDEQPAIWLVHNYQIHGHSGRLKGYTRPNPDFYLTQHLIQAWLAPRPKYWKY